MVPEYTSAELKLTLNPQVFLKDSLTLPTILALGAVVQIVFLAILPARYALLPVAFILGRSVVTTIFQIRSLASDPFKQGVIPGRVTAQLPFPIEDGTQSIPPSLAANFGNVPASAPLVTFHLGIRFHHPLGLLSPGAREIGAHFQSMSEALHARRDEFGAISLNLWRGTEDRTHNTIMLIAYFRSVADLSRFAHDPVHREGWDWYNQFVRETGYRHFGIFHETFVSRPAEWETIYVDCEPTLLGAGSVRVAVANGGTDTQETETRSKEEGRKEELWTRPIVSADHPALKSQAKRMPGIIFGVNEDLKRNL